MRYIERDRTGKIVAAFAVEQFAGQECLPDHHPDIVAAFVPPVPISASATGILRALHARGLLAAVDAAVEQKGDELMKRLWARATTFERNDPMVLAVADALHMTDELDALFVEANK
jgi:hypothetical protein